MSLQFRPIVPARAALAAVLAAAIVTAGAIGVSVTAAPRWVSTLVEPLSLLLMPGLILSLVTANAHDFSVPLVLIASVLFYLSLFYLLLTRRSDRIAARIAARTPTRTPPLQPSSPAAE